MVVCKYFLQGTCRFGANCKFEHQVSNDHNYANSTSPLLQGYTNKPAQTTTNVDTNTLVKSVVNDMTSVEKGGQWLLSSYAPFKEKPAFPGFEDHSMEEIRYLFYESVKNGSVEQFKHSLQMMLQQAVMKIRALQNPSPDAVNMLKTIYNTPPSSSFGNNQAAFNSPQTNSVFANSTPQQNSVFGGPALNQKVFGTSNAPSSIFGSTQSPQQNGFMGSVSNSFFAGGQSNAAVLNNQQQPTQNKSIFGNHQQTAVFGNSSIFNNGPQTFASQQKVASTFNQQSSQQTPFNTPQQNIFQPQNTTNQFGVQTSNTQFRPSQQTMLVGENKTAFQHTTSIFGNLGMQADNSVFAAVPTQPKPYEDFYSKLEELSEDDIKWFQSDDLDVNKIPDKPPTYEMCLLR